MNKIDKLSLSREEVLQQISEAMSIKEIFKILFNARFKHSEIEQLNQKYDIDVREITSKNRKTANLSITGRKKSGYGTWKCHKCGLIFETRALRQKHTKEVHAGEIWNKGLTKDTSESVRKSSNTLQKHIADGTYVPKGYIPSKEIKEKISKSMTRHHQEYGGFKNVKWYKVCNLAGIEYTVRGHWEENVAKRLNQLGYNWIKNTWLEYDDNGIRRHYNPDFYLPDLNAYIEVKGYYSKHDKIKMQLVMQQYQNITIFFLHGKDYTDFASGKLPLGDSVKMDLNQAKFW